MPEERRVRGRRVAFVAACIVAVVLLPVVPLPVVVLPVDAATPPRALLTSERSESTDVASTPRSWAVDELLDIAEAVAAGRRFLDDWVDPDGRVVRRDQGGDTVSEGQAYAMTIAAAIGDEPTFRRVWRWTADELWRDDGLFAWRWADGAVADRAPAADADLMIAGALSLAADRFGDAALADAARATSDAVLEHETVDVDGRRVLVAGPWARASRVVNPSYAVLPVMSRLWFDGEWQWAAVAASSRSLIAELTATPPHLPPDWAAVAADGTSAQPLGRPPTYGWDAVRVPVQLAADCSLDGRSIAARMWPYFLSQAVVVASVVDIDGSVVDAATHATAIVGAAGAASAAGAHDSVDVLLARAERSDAEWPTYYGAAWIALGRLWLTTDLLGGCAGG